MLGRQQIAGIQNALSELFKNAHDAYATHVVADYFEDSGPNELGFIVIRDNGVGMTLTDFETKWLVLGTESKTEGLRTQLYRPKNMDSRPISGEKGIGRLAVALLGRVMLILTRAQREDGLHDLVAGLIHWGLFEVPALDLDEIEIPVKTFPGGVIPTQAELQELRKALLDCAKRIGTAHPNYPMDEVFSEIQGFDPDPETLDVFFTARDEVKLSLTGAGTGTHFLIGPCNPIIRSDLNKEDRDGDYGFRKQLLGFCDAVFAEAKSPTIQTSFRRWRPGDLIG